MATDDKGSVTLWVGDLKDGDHAAAQKLWERYGTACDYVPLTTLPEASNMFASLLLSHPSRTLKMLLKKYLAKQKAYLSG